MREVLTEAVGEVAAMQAAVAGVIGYYGRATPLSWADCKEIERTRARVLEYAEQHGGMPGGQSADGGLLRRWRQCE